MAWHQDLATDNTNIAMEATTRNPDETGASSSVDQCVSVIMQGERKGWVSTSDQADRREDKGEEMALLVRRQHQGALRGRGT